MPIPTQQDLLELTRQVFTGAVTRAQLAARSSREQVFVATGIMLVVRDKYLYDDYTVKGVYSKALEELLIRGTVNVFVERGSIGAQALISAARNSGLYSSTPGRGGIKPIVLEPPAELVELVRELGRTDAITAFLRDAEAGARQYEQWVDEWNAALDSKHRQEYLERVLEEVASRCGSSGLEDLRSMIEERLRQ